MIQTMRKNAEQRNKIDYTTKLRKHMVISNFTDKIHSAYSIVFLYSFPQKQNISSDNFISLESHVIVLGNWKSTSLVFGAKFIVFPIILPRVKVHKISNYWFIMFFIKKIKSHIKRNTHPRISIKTLVLQGYFHSSMKAMEDDLL